MTSLKPTRLLIWASTITLSVIISTAAIAQCGGGAPSGCGSGSSGGCGSGAPAVVDTAKATSQTILAAWQEKKIDQIDKERDAKLADLQPKFQKARQDVNSLIDDPRATDDAIEKKIKEAMDLQAQIVAANMIAERRKDRTLTPEQSMKLASSQGGSGGCGSAPSASSQAGAAGCGSGGGGGCGSTAPAAAQPAKSSGGCGSSCGG